MHKNKESPPGQLIVSRNCNLTDNITMYVDMVLKSHVKRLPLYNEDSKDCVKWLSNLPIGEETLLASLDVEALYTKIDHKLHLEACKYFLLKKGIYFQKHSGFFLNYCFTALFCVKT